MVDASQGEAQEYVSNILATSGSNEVLTSRMELMGLSVDEVVALAAMPRSNAVMQRIGRLGSWSSETKVTNEFFRVLLSETWEVVPGTSDPVEYKARGKTIYISEHDRNILDSEAMKGAAEGFRDDPVAFKKIFQRSWSRMSGLGVLRPVAETTSSAVRVGCLFHLMVALVATALAACVNEMVL